MQKKRIVKNLFAYALAEIVNKASPFVVLFLAQRRLGLEAFGFANIALALVEIVLPFVPFGYSLVATKLVGKHNSNPSYLGELVSSVIVLRLLHAFVGAALLIGFCWVIPDYRSYLLTVSVLSVSLLFAAFELSFVQVGKQDLHKNTLAQAMAKLISLALIFLLVHRAEDAGLFAAIYMVPNIIVCLSSFLQSRRYFKISKPTPALMQNLFKTGLMAGGIYIISIVFDRISILLCEHFMSLAETGIYSGINRITQSLFHSIAAVSVIFFSELVVGHDRSMFTKHINTSLSIICAMMLPIAVGVWFVDDALISLFLGSEVAQTYASLLGIFVLNVFFWGLINTLGLQVLVIHNLEKIYVYFLLFGVIAEVVFGFFAVQAYGLYGLALASLMAKVITLFAVLFASHRFLDRFDFRTLTKILVACAVMGVGLYFIQFQFELPWQTVLSTVLMGAFLFSIAGMLLFFRELQWLWQKSREVIAARLSNQ